MNDINAAKMSFGTTPKDIKAIKNACDTLAEKITTKNRHSVSIDSLEIGDRLFLSANPEKGESFIKVELQSSKGINSYTYIKTHSIEDSKKFLKSNNAVTTISTIIDSLKKAVEKAKNTGR